MMYVANPDLGSAKLHDKSRRRFRMSFSAYVCLLETICDEEEVFKRWLPGRNYWGNKTSPIELLLLGALRYIERGLTFDDLEEYTAISEETHRQFLHSFIQYGSTRLFNAMVTMPTTVQEYQQSQRQNVIG
jgi:hypothetical protein